MEQRLVRPCIQYANTTKRKGLAAGCHPRAVRAVVTSRLSIAILQIAKTRSIVNLRFGVVPSFSSIIPRYSVFTYMCYRSSSRKKRLHIRSLRNSHWGHPAEFNPDGLGNSHFTCHFPGITPLANRQTNTHISAPSRSVMPIISNEIETQSRSNGIHNVCLCHSGNCRPAPPSVDLPWPTTPLPTNEFPP